MKKLVYILVFFLSFITSAQNISLFEQGNALYNDGNYEQAILKYENILENGEHSAELYFNLGNANYKLNNVAPSIYFYEKALQLEPKNKEIQNNLAFAQNMTIDAIDPVPEIGLSKFLRQAINSLSFDVWAILAVSFMVLFDTNYL